MPYQGCRDVRPCLIVDAHGPRFWAVPLSSARDLFDPQSHFPIPDDDFDFPSTGLKRTSYAIVNEVREVTADMLKKRLGSMQGDLARRYIEWAG